MTLPFSKTSWFEYSFNDEWTIGYLLYEASTFYGNAPALVTQLKTVHTYKDIKRLAGSLRSIILQKSKQSDAIACLTTLDLPNYICIQAMMTSGRIYVPLDAHSPHCRNDQCLKESGAKLILSSADCKEQAAELGGDTIPVIVIEEHLKHTPAEPIYVAPSEPAAYIFTSGSTGKPKAVIRTQQDLAHAFYSLSKTYNTKSTDIYLLPGSPGHIGSLNGILGSMVSGLLMVTIDIAKINIAQILALIKEWNVTVLDVPPSLLRIIISAFRNYDEEHCIHTVITSGEALHRIDVKHFYKSSLAKAKLWQNYGSTETGPMYAGNYTLEDAKGSGPLPLRLPADACEIRIENSDGELAEVNESGNFVVYSKYLAKGYLNPTVELKSKFQEKSNGINSFVNGDNGYRSEQNELVITGRSDRQININGRRYEQGEIEAAILQYENIVEVVVSVFLIAQRPSIGALITTETSKLVNISELKIFLKTKLPQAAIPTKFVITDSMPKTSSGKADRHAISKLIHQQSFAISEIADPPRGTIENWIADCWQELLKINRPSRSIKLEYLGGDSIIALELLVMLERRFGFHYNVDLLYINQTIASQANLIESGNNAHQEVLITLRDDEQGPKIILVPGFGGHAWNYQELAAQFNIPCTIQAISLDTVFSKLNKKLTQKNIINIIVENINLVKNERPIWIGGYSFGAIIAANLAQKMQGQIEGLLLIDPQDLRGTKWTQYYKAMIYDWYDRHSPASNKSHSLKKFEAKIARIKRLQRKIFRNLNIKSANTSVKLLLCNKNDANSLAINPLLCEISTISGTHLEIMQMPLIKKTAQWMEQSIE